MQYNSSLPNFISVERSEITCESSITNFELRQEPKNGGGCLCRNSKSQQKFVAGCLVVLCLAITWVASAQLCRETYIPGQFHSPLLCMYFWTSWLVFFYPVYIAIELILSKGEFPVRQKFRYVINATEKIVKAQLRRIHTFNI